MMLQEMVQQRQLYLLMRLLNRQCVKAAGANPIVLKRGIEKATQFVVRKVTEYARPIEQISDITKVATISAGNDTEVGTLIASAIDKVGREGLISLKKVNQQLLS